MPKSLRVKGVGGNHGITGTPGKYGGTSHGSPSAPLRTVHLSSREREILRYIAAGHTTKELAAALNIAESTAEWHISNILAELGAASRAEAVAIGLREGLLEPEEQPLPGKSATDLKTGRAHRAHASRDDRIIRFDLFGLHLGEIRIGRSRRDVAQTEAKPFGGEAGEARGRNGAERGER